MGIKKRKTSGGKFKKPGFNGGKPPLTYTHPIFCFKYLDKRWGLEKCDNVFKSSTLNTLVSLSQSTWQELQSRGRHKGGYEKVDPKTFKLQCRLPPEIYLEDIDSVLSFRVCGKHPFVAIRKENVLHILGFDRNFKMYEHGS